MKIYIFFGISYFYICLHIEKDK